MRGSLPACPRSWGTRDSASRYLSFDEREQIALWRAEKVGVREIAPRLGPATSTV
jgi:IS30 family transposase